MKPTIPKTTSSMSIPLWR